MSDITNKEDLERINVGAESYSVVGSDDGTKVALVNRLSCKVDIVDIKITPIDVGEPPTNYPTD